MYYKLALLSVQLIAACPPLTSSRVLNFVPLKKSATAEDIAHRIMWFVDSKNLITGETIYVDGGYHLKA